MTRDNKFLVMLIVMLYLCVFVACVETKRTPPTIYQGPQPQTPEAILEAFDANLIAWTKQNSNELNMHLNEKYPPTEWLQMLIDKGIIIEDAHDFTAYIAIRKSLDERAPKHGIWRLFNEDYDDWETFKDAFIKRKIWEHDQFKVAQQKNSNVWWVDFLGADGKTVVPITNSSRYVKVTITKHKNMGVGVGMSGGGASRLSEQQKFDLAYKGKHPMSLGGWKWGWGWKILYLDEENNVLPKKPDPISREDLSLPPDVPWPPKNREHLNRIIDEVKANDMLED